MKIFLAGISCVGKTAIGNRLAEKLGYPFYDFDVEIEKFFGEPIERLQARFLTPYTFRKKTAPVLKIFDIAGLGIEEATTKIRDILYETFKNM